MIPLALALVGGYFIGDALKNKKVFAKGGVMTKGEEIEYDGRFQKDLEKLLKNEGLEIAYYDKYVNNVSKDKAVEISVYRFEPYYESKSIRQLPKKVNFEWIMNKISDDKVYKNFSDYFNKLLKAKGFEGINAYPTTYGIGVFSFFGFDSKTKEKIEGLLKSLGIEYTTEYSDAQWVFRYKISKSRKNIEKINAIKMAEGGVMEDGGDVEDDGVIRGFFDDEAYAYAEGGVLKGSNPKTGETYGVVIGSQKKSDEISGGTEINVRKSYSERISESKLIFNSEGDLYRIIDYGYSIGGYPNTSYGQGHTYNADKKETLQILSEEYNPSFAKKIIAFVKGAKMAEGGTLAFAHNISSIGVDDVRVIMDACEEDDAALEFNDSETIMYFDENELSPENKKKVQRIFKKRAFGGDIEGKEDFLEDVAELHNSIKEITLKDGSKISNEELMEAHFSHDYDDDDVVRGFSDDEAYAYAKGGGIKSKKSLFKDLEEIDAIKFKGVSMKSKYIEDETYGDESYIYIDCDSNKERQIIQNALIRKGYKINTNYWKEGSTIEVRVSYFKGKNWDE